MNTKTYTLITDPNPSFYSDFSTASQVEIDRASKNRKNYKVL